MRLNKALKFLWYSLAFLSLMLGAWYCQLSPTITKSTEAERDVAVESESFGTALTNTVYLPLVAQPNPFLQNKPIWPHTNEPPLHEVALFRHTFAINGALENAKLFIFADTRYEVWLDGNWVGRGPARFSEQTREYDVYELEDLPPGEHVIAVLVQWAPNWRRSFSTTPHLLTHIQGSNGNQTRFVARTGFNWKTLSSPAWRADAAPVHTFGILGPTELLDLRQLPFNWMKPDFSDADWPAAAVKESPPNVEYLPRSIPFLVNVPFTVTLIDAGLLSPARVVSQLNAPEDGAYQLTFDALEATNLTLETLTATEILPASFPRLNGNDLNWEQVGAERPDVYRATAQVSAGTHTLSFADIPPAGLPFSISKTNLQLPALPFEQSVHAGRRLLLAEPVGKPGEVIASGGKSLALEFTTTPAYAVLDLGRVIHGRLQAEALGPAGSVIDIGWDERVFSDTLRPLPYPGSLHPQWNQSDSWILDGASRAIETIDARAGRYILIAVWGKGPIRLQNIQVNEERYPAVPRGRFESSDERLNQIWQVGVDTLYPNMTDAYADPWRERGQWWGDAYVDDQINQAAFGEIGLLRRGLLQMAEAFDEGRPPAFAPRISDEALLLDYGMLWVQSLHDYRRITGELDIIERHYPVLQQFMSFLAGYKNAETGLLDLPDGPWWETALIDWRGDSSRNGQSTALNALYYKTLLDAAELAEDASDTTQASIWRQEGTRVKEQINAVLYLKAEKRYIAALFDGQKLAPSPHAQAWPLAYGIVPEDDVSAVSDSLMELLSPDPDNPNLETLGMFWVLKGLGEAGRIADALAAMESFYGRQLDLGATTWWEGSQANLYYYGALSHGWGGSPTWFLTSYLLGARRTGVNSWQVKPAFEGVDYVSGALPLAAGELEVYWERPTCESARVELSAPPGTSGTLAIPFIGPTTVLTMNGSPAWREGIALLPGVAGDGDAVNIFIEQAGQTTLSAEQLLCLK